MLTFSGGAADPRFATLFGMKRRTAAATATAVAAIGALGAIALSSQPQQKSATAATPPANGSRTTTITKTIHDPVDAAAATQSAPQPSVVDVAAAAAVDLVKSKLADDGKGEHEGGEGNDD